MLKAGEVAIVFVVGMFAGGLIGYSMTAVDAQGAYQEGRQSVLDRVVTVGDASSPCTLKIPLSVLADMVNSGVMLWHERCAEMAEAERGKP